jgi:hypothetical protein
MSPTEVTPGSSADSPRKDRLINVDGRSSWARRFREYLGDHFSDIPDASSAERSIIRRASVLEVALEKYETKFAQAGQASAADLETYQRCANTLRRLLEAVGLQRRPRDMSVIDAETEAIGHAEAMERRRAHIEAMHSVLAEQAGTTVVYDDP